MMVKSKKIPKDLFDDDIPKKPRAGNPNFQKGKPNQYYPEENKRRAALAPSNSEHPTFEQYYGITPKANPTKRKRYYLKMPVISVRTKKQRKVFKFIILILFSKFFV